MFFQIFPYTHDEQKSAICLPRVKRKGKLSLHFWKFKCMDRVSIVIPTLNEEQWLPGLLDQLNALDPPPYEIIVSDGTSKDETVNIIRRHNVRYIRSIGRGRAVQMNEGAYRSKGDLLVFLHVDTKVPSDLVQTVRRVMRNKKVVLAGFVCLLKHDSIPEWVMGMINFLKIYLGAFLYNPYRFLFYGLRFLSGDQVLFCRKNEFLKVNGYNMKLPVMEDVDLCIRMNKIGHIRQINSKVEISGRQMERLGPFRFLMCHIKIFILWSIGASPYWIKSQYGDF